MSYRIFADISFFKSGTYWAVVPPVSDSSDEQLYSYVIGQRGAPKIIYDGFSYICAKTLNDRKYWVNKCAITKNLQLINLEIYRYVGSKDRKRAKLD